MSWFNKYDTGEKLFLIVIYFWYAFAPCISAAYIWQAWGSSIGEMASAGLICLLIFFIVFMMRIVHKDIVNSNK
jgi:hypothetical protein